MSDEYIGFFTRLKPGDEFVVRFPDGSEHVARIEDAAQQPGDPLMIRGTVELRNFAYPPDAPTVEVSDGR
jgi:hypothetical protein